MKTVIISAILLCQNMTTWWPERSLPDDIDARIETCIEIAVKSPEYNIDPVMAISFAYQESKFDATAI